MAESYHSSVEATYAAYRLVRVLAGMKPDTALLTVGLAVSCLARASAETPDGFDENIEEIIDEIRACAADFEVSRQEYIRELTEE